MRDNAATAWVTLRFLSCAIAIALMLIPYWPAWPALQWVTLLVLYAPPWWYLAVFLPWCVNWRSIKYWHCLMLLPLLVSGVRILDVSLPVASTGQAADFVTLSANLGNMRDGEVLARLLQQHNVSVALFQEARPDKLEATIAAGWQTHCDAGLCIASQFPFDVEHTMSRSIFKGYGNFAVFYRVHLPGVTLMMANVHFETPRPALESLLKLKPDSRGMQFRPQDRQLQATIISEWAQTVPEPVIIAGDFNMPIASPIYQQYFSTLGNALSDKPQQVVNYTKYTNWHGIRIDHQLYRGKVEPLAAYVLSLRGGDHRPVLVTWRK